MYKGVVMSEAQKDQTDQRDQRDQRNQRDQRDQRDQKNLPESWFDAHGVQHGMHGATNRELTEAYDRLASKYDQYFLGPGMTYSGINKVRDTLSELFPSNRDDVIVLDIGAGTGILGSALKGAGFSQLDALDPSSAMLELAREKGIYRTLLTAYLTDQPLDIATDSYDAVTMVGVVAPGTVPCRAFAELARIVKPGGYIVNSMRFSFLQDIPDFRDNWDSFSQRMESQGKWKTVKMERYPKQFMDHEGVIMVLKIC